MMLESIKKAAKLVAQDLMDYYHGDEPGNTVGILPGPPPDGDYYWWQGGALWGTMLDYWHWTEDDTWNDDVYASLLHQAAPTKDFMHDNWTASLGNDDQAFWGMSAMLAAEVGFRDPPKDEAQWLALAQAVWNEQTRDDRRDEECGGGLRWQIYSINTGYNYKNSTCAELGKHRGRRRCNSRSQPSLEDGNRRCDAWTDFKVNSDFQRLFLQHRGATITVHKRRKVCQVVRRHVGLVDQNRAHRQRLECS